MTKLNNRMIRILQLPFGKWVNVSMQDMAPICVSI